MPRPSGGCSTPSTSLAQGSLLPRRRTSQRTSFARGPRSGQRLRSTSRRHLLRDRLRAQDALIASSARLSKTAFDEAQWAIALAKLSIDNSHTANKRAGLLEKQQAAMQVKANAQAEQLRVQKIANAANAAAAKAAQASADANARELEAQARENELTQRLALATSELALANTDKAETQRKQLAAQDARLDEHANAINHNADILDRHSDAIAEHEARLDEHGNAIHKNGEDIHKNGEATARNTAAIAAIEEQQGRNKARLDRQKEAINHNADVTNQNIDNIAEQKRKNDVQDRQIAEAQDESGKLIKDLLQHKDYRCESICACSAYEMQGTQDREQKCRECLSDEAGFWVTVGFIDRFETCRHEYCDAVRVGRKP